jgi:hypothetical protein
MNHHTYRVRCEGISADIVAESPEDAVQRVHDLECFAARSGELRFAVYEITGFDKDRFRPRPYSRRLSEEEKMRLSAQTEYIKTITIRQDIPKTRQAGG